MSDADEFEDRQGNINAKATGVETTRGPLAVARQQVALLEGADKISIDWSADYAQANSIGFVAELSVKEAGSLISYGGALTLERLTDGRLQAKAHTPEGTVSVSSEPLLEGEWVKIGVHVRDGELLLGIDDKTYKTTLTTQLEVDSSSDLIRINAGASSNSQLLIAHLKLIDWNGVSMLEMDSQNGKYVVGDDGYANARISVPAAYIALNQQRQRDRLYEMYAKQTRFQLIPSAYAGDLGDCAMQVSAVDEAGFGITAGWAMLYSLSECVLQRKIQKQVVSYENADGTRGAKAIAMVQKAVLESVYSALTVGADVALVAKDCAVGVLTGDMDNAAMATCSLVSSLFVIGDIRDLAINGWYWFIDDEENFSAMDATFATLGIAGVALAGTVAGAPVGGTIKVVATAGKVIPKAFKGAKFIRPLGSYLSDKVLIKDIDKGTEAFLKVLPFMEVAAFVGFTSLSDEGKPIRDFMANAIQDADDLDAWIDYIGGLSKAIADGVIAEADLNLSDQVRKQLYAFVTEVLINQAYAGLKDQLSTKLVSEFLDVLNEVRGDISKYANVDGQPTLARYFTEAIDALRKNRDEGVDYLADLKYEPAALKLLVAAYGAGDKAAVEGIRRLTGYRPEALDLPIKDMLQHLSEIDYSGFSDEDLKALGKVFEKFAGDINASQGAIGEALTIRAMQKLGRPVSRIQEWVPITGPDGTVIAHRVSDMFIDGVFADVKTVSPEGLAKLMEFGTKPGAVVEDKLKDSGQLFRDLVDMGNNEGTKKILVLPPHAEGREGEVLEAIFDGASSEGTKDELMKMWKLKPGDPDDETTFSTKLLEMQDDFEVMVLKL
ncbi:hypothetical protein [Thalassolituus sp.]|uniref:hypothetical protein n=1 Tax=Thalassolituus sp. TaxID=2030822 RepID=UPI0035127ED7